MLTQDQLTQRLHPRAVRFFPSVDSTNSLATDWLRQGGPTGSAVIADEQRHGRGRMGRTWHTPPNVALAVSVLLHPPQAHLTRVSLVGALAVAQLCESLGIQDVGIKWPNDVQIQGRKVSGILPEAVWDESRLLGVVLGMGINVRVDFGTSDLAQTAINLEQATQSPLDRAELIAQLLGYVDAWAAHIHTPELFHAWRNRLNMLGARVHIEGLAGIAEDVTNDGALLLRLADGALKQVLAGTIAYEIEG